MSLAVVGALSLLGLAAGLLRPRMGWLWLILASVLVEVLHAFSPGVSQYGPWVGVFIGIFAAELVNWRLWLSHLRTSRRYFWWVALYLAALIVATIFGIDLRVSMRYALGVPAVLWVATLYLPQIARSGSVTEQKLAQSWALVGVLMTLTAGLGALIFHSGFPVPVGHRIILAWQWPFANKNTLGMLMTFAVPAAFGLIFYPGQLWGGRWPATVMAIIVIVGDALSYARSGWIASLIGMAVFVLAYFGRRGFLGMAIGLPIAAVALVMKTGIRRWTLLWDKGLNGRTILWRAGLKALQHRWLFGVGPGNSPQAILPYVPRAYAGLTPHDSILRTAVELGIVGLMIWLVIVVGSVLKSGQDFWLSREGSVTRWNTSIIMALLLATLAQQMVESLFLGGVSFGDFFFTILVGWVWFVNRPARSPYRGAPDRR